MGGVELHVVELGDHVSHLQSAGCRRTTLVERHEPASLGHAAEHRAVRRHISGGRAERRDDDLSGLEDLLDVVLNVRHVEAHPGNRRRRLH